METNNLYDEIKSLNGKNNKLVISKKSDNIIMNLPGTGKKIMFSIVVQDRKLIIKKVEKNKAEFETIWDRDKNVITDKIVYMNNEPVGVVRKDKDKEFVEIFTSKEIKIGDVLEFNIDYTCKGNMLYTTSSSYEIARVLAKEIALVKSDTVNDIYFTASKSTYGALAVANSVMPDYIFSIYTAPESEIFAIGNGCGIMLKDGNAVAEQKLYKLMCDISADKSVKFQPFNGKKNKLVEQFGIIGTGAKVGGICIPCSGCDSVTEVVNTDDITNAANLIAGIVEINFDTEG